MQGEQCPGISQSSYFDGLKKEKTGTFLSNKAERQNTF